MPLAGPQIDNRDYQALVDEMIARIPVHTPEWTNFNSSDPGITRVQLFAHVAESVIYRANQIPERNRAKFLQLLGIGLQSAREARGIVAFNNERGPLASSIIAAGSELTAGKIPFRTTLGIDALPVEARIFRKIPIAEPAAELLEYNELLYASYNREFPAELALYESVESETGTPLSFADTVDSSLWIALLGRPQDAIESGDPWSDVRAALAGRTISLGLVPSQISDMSLVPVGNPDEAAQSLDFEMPVAGSAIAFDENDRPVADYRELVSRVDFNPGKHAGVVQITLPSDPNLIDHWRDLDPLEGGVGDMPPKSDDAAIDSRIVTWLRVSASGSADLTFDWAGINAAPVRQYIRINSERLADGDNRPNQQRQLKRAPVLAGSVSLLSAKEAERRDWSEIDDLYAAASEVPGYGAPLNDAPVDVFTLDPESGVISFGDGMNGRRPRAGEALYASYEYSEGAEGNVGTGILKAGISLPAGITGSNPVPTWGGSDAENVSDGEKQVQRVLTHRDRLVTADDFRAIAWRTPGMSIGRVEIIPAAHPNIVPISSGSAPGAVTLMVIPANDAARPNAPRADRKFLDALCQYLEPRRLVTTELAVHGPKYVGIWLSVGVSAASGHSIAETLAAVKSRLQSFLSPLPPAGLGGASMLPKLYGEEADPALRGWPLNRAVHAPTLLAEAARASGVLSVNEVLMARGDGAASDQIALSGIELPEILGISITNGAAAPLETLRGTSSYSSTDGGDGSLSRLPVPVVAETC